MPLNNPSYRAEEAINTSLFVMPGTKDENILTADGSKPPVGVMHESSWHTPIPGVAGEPAVLIGESKRVYGIGEVCFVRVGAAVAVGAVAA